MARNTQKGEKWETNPVRPGIWQETMKKVQNEKCTLYNLEYGEKTEYHGK